MRAGTVAVVAAVVAAVVVGLTGCGGGGSSVSGSDLVGRTFVAVRAEGEQVVVAEFVDRATLHVDLGCDHLHDVEWDVDDDGRLLLPSPFTAGAECSDAEAIRDEAVLTILVSVPSVSLDGATLRLRTDDGEELVLTEGPAPEGTGR